MSMLSKRTTTAVLLAATGLSACVAAPDWVGGGGGGGGGKPMTAEQTDAVREACGPIPPPAQEFARGRRSQIFEIQDVQAARA